MSVDLLVSHRTTGFAGRGTGPAVERLHRLRFLHQPNPFPVWQPRGRCWLESRAQRDTNADFLRSLGDHVGEHAINADAGEDQRQGGEAAQQRGLDVSLRDFLIQPGP